MKATKFIILVGGILGLLAFFLPLVSVQRGGTSATVSAFQIIKGLDTVSVAVDQASTVDVATSASAQSDIGAMKGIVMAIFAPAALLTLLGGLGVMRRRFGRLAGTFSLLAGLAGLGIAAVLKGAAGGDSGIGMSILLLTGALGVIGGVLGLAKPERLAATVANSYGTSLAPVATAPAVGAGADTVMRRVA
jgi:hypothetical protein